MALAPRTPSHTHWSALRLYLQLAHNELMELEEFLRIWEVSREELAFICDCSVTTVNHWFSQGEHRRFPGEKHQQKLALAPQGVTVRLKALRGGRTKPLQ